MPIVESPPVAAQQQAWLEVQRRQLPELCRKDPETGMSIRDKALGEIAKEAPDANKNSDETMPPHVARANIFLSEPREGEPGIRTSFPTVDLSQGTIAEPFGVTVPIDENEARFVQVGTRVWKFKPNGSLDEDADPSVTARGQFSDEEASKVLELVDEVDRLRIEEGEFPNLYYTLSEIQEHDKYIDRTWKQTLESQYKFAMKVPSVTNS